MISRLHCYFLQYCFLILKISFKQIKVFFFYYKITNHENLYSFGLVLVCSIFSTIIYYALLFLSLQKNKIKIIYRFISSKNHNRKIISIILFTILLGDSELSTSDALSSDV